MRSLKLAGLAFAATAALVLPASVRAQDNVEKVTFDTIDQVKLQGQYYPSAKLKKAPVVLVLHKFGGNSKQDGWDKLAVDLQKAGYAVLLFDFRGHGDSTAVQPGFWQDPINAQNVKGFNPQKPKDTISYKDFSAAYMPQLVNDIAAAKVYLDKRNDGNDCNSSNLILIGAEEGASLGMMWMYTEQMHYRIQNVQFNPVTGAIVNYQKNQSPMGTEVSAAIWLSIAPKIGNYSTPMMDWTKFTGREKAVPMAFVYGEKNTGDQGIANKLLSLAKDPDDKDRTKWTGEKPIKGTDVKGHALLSDKLDARDWIVNNYLKKLMDEKAMPVWEAKDIKKNGYVWEFPGRPVFSKIPEEDGFRKLPVDVILKP